MYKVIFIGNGAGRELHVPLKCGIREFTRGTVYEIDNQFDFNRLMRSKEFKDVTEYPKEEVTATPVVDEISDKKSKKEDNK